MGPRHWLFLGVFLALAACEAAPPFSAQPLPEVVPRPSLRPQSEERSIASFELEQFYLRLQNDLQRRGLLRIDGGTFDATYTEKDLVRNFIRIAMSQEFKTEGNFMVEEATGTTLRRWSGPIRVNLEFGQTVAESQQAEDRTRVKALTGTLSRVSGVPMRLSNAANTANFHVLVLNEDDRLAIRPRLKRLVPSLSEAAVRAIVNMDRSNLCIVFGLTGARAADPFTTGLVVVRAEQPDLMRRACFHEEMAQGLGLFNDDVDARPSLFNDDEEFGLLTVHDEQLIRMLYDRRLRNGMTADDVLPIAERIASELFTPQTN